MPRVRGSSHGRLATRGALKQPLGTRKRGELWGGYFATAAARAWEIGADRQGQTRPLRKPPGDCIIATRPDIAYAELDIAPTERRCCL